MGSSTRWGWTPEPREAMRARGGRCTGTPTALYTPCWWEGIALAWISITGHAGCGPVSLPITCCRPPRGPTGGGACRPRGDRIAAQRSCLRSRASPMTTGYPCPDTARGVCCAWCAAHSPAIWHGIVSACVYPNLFNLIRIFALIFNRIAACPDYLRHAAGNLFV